MNYIKFILLKSTCAINGYQQAEDLLKTTENKKNISGRGVGHKAYQMEFFE